MLLFPEPETVVVAPGAVLFRGAVLPKSESLLIEIGKITAESPLRRVVTPMGKPMSVDMTNCGEVGWVADRSGYRYECIDPMTSKNWPAMPESLAECAGQFAGLAGYKGFQPDTCLINRYSVGSKMGLHQDCDEKDFSQPIVSISLGLPITFSFGGTTRVAPTSKVKLEHGDVLVFGGASRLAYHGVSTLRRGMHPMTGHYRFNLTFRRSN